MFKSAIYFTITVLAAIGLLVWIAGPDKNTQNNQQSANVSNGIAPSLEVSETFFDFGKISMAAGVVTHDVKIKNGSSSDVIVSQIYTSCMCTKASLIKRDSEIGPFGMLGHGIVPKISTPINANEEATIKVEFDPAAHGPAGVGVIDRSVFVFQKGVEKPLEIKFRAIVIP